MLPVGLVGGLALAAMLNYVIPKKYESFATIEVKPQVRGEAHPSDFVDTEFAKITSRGSLETVIDRLDLINRWNIDKEGALNVLKKSVTIQNIRGTDLISITARHTNREDARDITAEVARAYAEYSQEIAFKFANKNLNELKEVISEQESKLEELRKVLVRISRIPLPNEPDPPETPIDLIKYKDAKRDFEKQQVLVERMKVDLIEHEINAKSVPKSIVIHDDPVISNSPVSPNVTLNLVLGSVGGFLLSPFFALPLMWFLNRRNPAQE